MKQSSLHILSIMMGRSRQRIRQKFSLRSLPTLQLSGNLAQECFVHIKTSTTRSIQSGDHGQKLHKNGIQVMYITLQNELMRFCIKKHSQEDKKEIEMNVRGGLECVSRIRMKVLHVCVYVCVRVCARAHVRVYSACQQGIAGGEMYECCWKS